MFHLRLSGKSVAGAVVLALASVLALAGTKPIVQTPTYTAPVLPPIFTAADLANSATLMTDVQTAYSNSTTLLLAHDSQLFDQGQAIQNQGTLILALQNQVAALQAQVAALTQPTMPTKATLTIQAESFTNTPVGQPGFPLTCAGGTGTTTCNSAIGETLTYAVNIPTAGNYQFSVNSSSTVGGTLTVNGVSMGTPNTASFSTFVTTTGPMLTFSAGPQTLTVVYTTAHQNLDFYTLVQQ